ncbi:MAG: PKD domain-containing protein [Saprospiraceae bacterium]|nr:PKD domain-containing protein [Saprospiraceae bacterium]
MKNKIIWLVQLNLQLAILNISWAQVQINAYEYWFNSNFAGRIVQNITLQESFELDIDLNTTGLDKGLNVIHLRFSDNDDNYSSIMSSVFIKMDLPYDDETSIVAYEYWFDNDYTSKIYVANAGSEIMEINENISALQIPQGIHLFQIRFLNAAGYWSPVTSQIFIRHKTETGDYSNLASYEYWFDNDYTSRVSVETVSTQHEWIGNINTESLAVGLHTFHFRYKNQGGYWSVINSVIFIKSALCTDGQNSLINGYRYWIDNDFSNATFVSLTPGEEIFLLEPELDMTRVWRGNKTLHIQFKDACNTWSGILSQNFEKIPYPLADFYVENNNPCPGESVTFVNNSVDADLFSWNFGDTQASNETNPAHIYNNSGNYTVSLMVTEIPTGLTNTQTKSDAVKVEGLNVYTKQDSIAGSLRNVIKCASPGDVILFSAVLDSSLLNAPILMNKNLSIHNNHTEKVVISGDYDNTGFNQSNFMIKIENNTTAEFKNLIINFKNAYGNQYALWNSGMLTLEDIVLKSNSDVQLINVQTSPENNPVLNIKGQVTIMKE